jgi:Tfp pilus assembly protein PilV
MGRPRAGSVLVEALVATTVVAVIMVGVLRVVGDSLARHRTVETRRMALMIARSQLAGVGFVAPLAEGTRTGEQSDYVWRIDVSRCAGEVSESSAGQLYCVTVAVNPPGLDRAAVTLATRRLAPEA